MQTQVDASIIREIKDKADIVEIISEQVRLQKKGKNFTGLCPFHLEDTPSFSVSRERQMYYCFGCHASGDVISYLMQTSGLTFMQSVETLGSRYGVKFSTKTLADHEKKQLEEREEIYLLHELSAKWYVDQLKESEEGKNARDYLKRRGLNEETNTKFQIGFAPAAWDKLSNYLLQKNFSSHLLLSAGLCIENKDGSIHDRFRNRVMFPIQDYRGRIIAFGGRVLDDSLPKYLNSPETLIFNKSQNLYGLSFAGQAIRHKNEAILVEGYMDVITCHQHGITNAVASLGTALTAEQGKLLLRYTEKTFFAYDSDTAGKKAVQKGIFILSELGLHIRVITYQDSKDPDEFLTKHNVTDFYELQKNAQNAISFLLSYYMAGVDLSNATEKAEVIQKVFPYIAKLKDIVVQEEYLKQTAFVLSVNERAVFAEFRKFQKKLPQDVNFSANFGKNTHVNIKSTDDELASLDKYHGKLLATALQNTTLRKSIAELIDFPFSDQEEINNYYLTVTQTELDAEELIAGFNNEWKLISRTILFNEKYLLEGKETVEDVIVFLRKQYLKQRLEEINEKLAQYNILAGLTEEFKVLLSEKQQLLSQLK